MAAPSRDMHETRPCDPADRVNPAADLENAIRCMRELGREGLEAFQETKHVHMESMIERKEWWYPYREHGSSAQD